MEELRLHITGRRGKPGPAVILNEGLVAFLNGLTGNDETGQLSNPAAPFASYAAAVAKILATGKPQPSAKHIWVVRVQISTVTEDIVPAPFIYLVGEDLFGSIIHGSFNAIKIVADTSFFLRDLTVKSKQTLRTVPNKQAAFLFTAAHGGLVRIINCIIKYATTINITTDVPNTPFIDAVFLHRNTITEQVADEVTALPQENHQPVIEFDNSNPLNGVLDLTNVMIVHKTKILTFTHRGPKIVAQLLNSGGSPREKLQVLVRDTTYDFFPHGDFSDFHITGNLATGRNTFVNADGNMLAYHLAKLTGTASYSIATSLHAAGTHNTRSSELRMIDDKAVIQAISPGAIYQGLSIDLVIGVNQNAALNQSSKGCSITAGNATRPTFYAVATRDAANSPLVNIVTNSDSILNHNRVVLNGILKKSSITGFLRYSKRYEATHRQIAAPVSNQRDISRLAAPAYSLRKIRPTENSAIKPSIIDTGITHHFPGTKLNTLSHVQLSPFTEGHVTEHHIFPGAYVKILPAPGAVFYVQSGGGAAPTLYFALLVSAMALPTVNVDPTICNVPNVSVIRLTESTTHAFTFARFAR